MKIPPPTITYDAGSRILSIKLSKARSVDSDVRGNVVVDYDAHGTPVRLDIMDCSLDEFRHAAPVRRHVHVRRNRHAGHRAIA